MPRQKKRWFLRWWFTIPFFTLLVATIVGLVFFFRLKWDYEAQANQFDYTRLEAMESASVILDRHGALLGKIFTQNRDQVGLDQLSLSLLEAVVAAEDARYYEHSGVDVRGVVRALYENWRAGKDKQGASTLTQQLARNTFPEQLPPNDRSKERKLREMFVAREIERRCTKQRILELYLNRVYFGNGFFGAESAAKGYFGKRASELDFSESAMLCGLLRSPDKLSPWRNYNACIEERNRVLARLLELNRVTREQYDKAFAEEPVLKNKRPIHQDNYPADMVYQQVLKIVGRDRATSEGLRIFTTIDSALQKKAEESLRTELNSVEQHPDFQPRDPAVKRQTLTDYTRIFEAANKQPMDAEGRRINPEYLQGAVLMLDNRTGGIIAMVGGRDFQQSELNRVRQVQLPPGTAFKPLVYAAAFENGMFPGTTVEDTVMDNTKVMIGGTTGILGEWGPERADNRFEGTISARTALVKSKNAATVRLGMVTGIKEVMELADSAGISSDLANYPRTYLGGSEVYPMELALSYTMFASGGMRPVNTFIIQRIEDKLGNVIFEEKPETVRVIKETTAYEVHSCLAQVLEPEGTGERASMELGLKRYPLGGKTGTGYNFTDAWFVGYSSEVTCAVWIGFDQQRGKSRQSIYRGAFGKDLALPVWAEVMKTSFEKFKPREFVQPKGIIRVEICRSSGGLATAKCLADGIQTTYQEICTEAQAPKDPCPVHSGVSPAMAFGGKPSPAGVLRARVLEPQTLKTVALVGPTVIGNDPYGSHLALERQVQLAGVGNAQAPLITQGEIPINNGDAPPVNIPPPRPIVVPPPPNNDVKLEQPEPLKFN
ncbi:MAG: transglycosylase domain-containing protein [Chthoniobacteraceae bacterium]